MLVFILFLFFSQTNPQPTNHYRCGVNSSISSLPRTNGVAKYSPKSGWSALSNSNFVVGGAVTTFAFSCISGFVYLGGQFLSIQGIADTRSIVSYNPLTDSYIAMASLNGEVSGIAVDPISDTVYVGGYFYLNQNGGNIRGLAYWNQSQSQWIALAHLNGVFTSMIFNGSQLLVTGYFTRIQGGQLKKWKDFNYL